MNLYCKHVMTGVFLFACAVTGSAQDGPFSFNNKTRVFTGSEGHWMATQDAFLNFVWNSYSTRYFKINNTTFQQNGNLKRSEPGLRSAL